MKVEVFRKPVSGFVQVTANGMHVWMHTSQEALEEATLERLRLIITTNSLITHLAAAWVPEMVWFLENQS